MNFSESDLLGVAMIGFDMIDGPFLKWTRQFAPNNQVNVQLDDFAMNFYLAFKGGNDGLKPKAILYEDFYIVAFPRGLELCCMFMQPANLVPQFQQLAKVAERAILSQDLEEEESAQGETPEAPEDDIAEIKRVLVSLLQNNEMSTPELRRAFQLNNSQIWKIMSDLENDSAVTRTGKKGRAICWTAC